MTQLLNLDQNKLFYFSCPNNTAATSNYHYTNYDYHYTNHDNTEYDNSKFNNIHNRELYLSKSNNS